MKSEINKLLGELNYTPTIPGEIDGQPVFFTEAEVRALQIMCKRCDTYQKYVEFRKKYVVYGDVDKTYKMEFSPTGRFINKFKKGFFDVNDTLMIDLI